MWGEGLLGTALQDVNIGTKWILVVCRTVMDRDIGLIDPSVFVGAFSVFDDQSGTRKALDGYFAHPGNVSSEVENI